MTSFLYETPAGASSVSFERRDGQLIVDGQAYECDGQQIWLDGRRVPFWTHQSGETLSVWLDGEVYRLTHKDPRHREEQAEPASSGLVCAQMPGKILSLAVGVGESVRKGQNLLIMESMKMELALDAPIDGVVEAVEVCPGQMVALGERLVVLAGEDQPG